MNQATLFAEKFALLSEDDQGHVLEVIDGFIGSGQDGRAEMHGEQYLTSKHIGPYAKALLVETDNEIYAVDPRDRMVGRSLRYEGASFAVLVDHVKGFLDQDSNVLVVGADIGTIVIPVSRSCAGVVAVEAEIQSFQLLEFNLHVNQVTNCICHHIAPNDRAEYVRYLRDDMNGVGFKRRPVAENRVESDAEVTEVVVPSFPLDQYLSDIRFDVIVLNIGPAGYFALKGMQGCLSTSRSLILIMDPAEIFVECEVSVEDLVDQVSVYTSMYTLSEGQGQVREKGEWAKVFGERQGPGVFIFKR